MSSKRLREILKKIQSLQSEIDTMNETEPKEGDLCEFWDDNYKNSKYLGYFKEKLNNVFCEKDNGTYDHARKLETKATRIEWDGGECPVHPKNEVVIEYGGGTKDLDLADVFDWENGSDLDESHHIVAYWRLDL